MVMVDDNVAEPDSRSMKELKEMGMIDLKAVKEEDDTEAFYSLHQIGDDEVDPRRQDEGMHYDNEVIFDDDVYEWIKKCVEKPLKVPKAEATSEAARIMRIRQPEVLMWYNITCDDWSSILRRYIVNVTYSNFTPLSVIQDACATLAIDGLTMEHVSTSDSAMTTSFASKTYSIKSYDDVIADVLKLVNRAYFVDAYRDIHVYSTGTVNCPISLTDDSNNYRNLKVRRDGSCYANTEFLTTGTLSVKGGSASSPWYIQNINNTLEYGYNSDMINAQKSVENGGWGQYDFAQNDNTITDEHVAISRIEADLTKYGQIAETLQFDTDCAGIEVGQVLSAVLSAHNVSGQYLLTTVSIQDKSGMLLRKTVTAIKGVYQFQWIDFFKSLGKQGA